MPASFIDPTATVEPPGDLGRRCRAWHCAHIRQGAIAGAECTVGKSAYVDTGVVIGDRVKLQTVR